MFTSLCGFDTSCKNVVPGGCRVFRCQGAGISLPQEETASLLVFGTFSSSTSLVNTTVSSTRSFMVMVRKAEPQHLVLYNRQDQMCCTLHKNRN